jgi:hypothetical protein
VPDDQDFEALRKHLGTNAEKYRLAQERKLCRLYETGRNPRSGLDLRPRKISQVLPRGLVDETRHYTGGSFPVTGDS